MKSMEVEERGEGTFLIIGGGIAGVTCAENLNVLSPDTKITLITAVDLVKSVVNLNQYGRYIEEFDVEEKTIDSFSKGFNNLTIVKDTVKSFNPEEHYVSTSNGHIYKYKKLCICTGGTPWLIDYNNPHVIGIRDTHSIEYFKTRLADARRVVIVGNGGIALELVFELAGCQVLWIIKDDAIGNNYFDKGAATFLLSHLESRTSPTTEEPISKRMKYQTTEKQIESPLHKDASSSEVRTFGGALGPDWSQGFSLQGNLAKEFDFNTYRNIHTEYNCEVEETLSPEDFAQQNLEETLYPKPSSRNAKSVDFANWPVYIKLTNSKIYGCDFVVSATGVSPNTSPFVSSAELDLSPDGGIRVDDNMRTSIPDVYAAGDVCTASWEPSKLWFQMRLWTQARVMGAFAARCMSDHLFDREVSLDFCFELFTHVTKFFGFKVVLLGKYNAQGMGDDYQVLLRCTKGEEYVKVLLQNGRMVGAVLIGETDLEETFENLILNEMDLSQFGVSLLDPRVDIDDFFD